MRWRCLPCPRQPLERYRGVLLTRRTTGLASVAEIAARAGELRYGEVLPGSTSGALVQAGELRRAGGATVRFATTRHAGTHEAALDDLLAGRTDVAALAEEPWRMLIKERPDQASFLLEVWRSPPLPPGPVVCVESRRLRCTDVAKTLLDGGTLGREAARALAAGWSETARAEMFVRVDSETYTDFVRP